MKELLSKFGLILFTDHHGMLLRHEYTVDRVTYYLHPIWVLYL